MSAIKAVIFDLDDTLIDWSKRADTWSISNNKQSAKVHAYLLENGLFPDPPDMEQFAEIFHTQIMQVWTEAKPDWRGAKFTVALERILAEFQVTGASIDTLLHVYDWEPMPGVIPYPDAIQTLQALQEQGYQLGLITNSFFPMWMRDVELKVYDLIDYLPHRITSGDTGYMKPHPAIYWRMLGMLNLMPHEAVFVGDSPSHDIAGANEVGLTSVLMKPAHLDRNLGTVVPDYTINQLDELLPILQNLS